MMTRPVPKTTPDTALAPEKVEVAVLAMKEARQNGSGSLTRVRYQRRLVL